VKHPIYTGDKKMRSEKNELFPGAHIIPYGMSRNDSVRYAVCRTGSAKMLKSFENEEDAIAFAGTIAPIAYIHSIAGKIVRRIGLSSI